ncbi:MAG: zf-HC2 domain-containing protein [Candidatus Baltobacteraceae bacterium]
MHCSSCERVLERYLDGTLHRRRTIAVDRHLAVCASCKALLTELKVVDGLLATVGTPQPAPNFSFAIMAEARSLAAPRSRRAPLWPLLGLYVTIAWILAAAWLSVSGGDIRVLAQHGFGVTASAFSGLSSAAVSAFHGLGHGAPLIGIFVAGVLILDLALAIGVFIVYRVVRPRLAAQLVRTGEIS